MRLGPDFDVEVIAVKKPDTPYSDLPGGIDGIVGLDVFQRKIVTFDFRRMHVTWGEFILAKPGPGSNISCTARTLCIC